jgi:hypothetical protein
VRISAVLDSARVSWGDTRAPIGSSISCRASERAQAMFSDAYERPDITRGARFRAHVYEGLHVGNVLSEARRGQTDLEPAVQTELSTTFDRMRRMSG